MSGLDPIPHLRIAQKPPSSKFGCLVCKTCFAAKDGYILLTGTRKTIAASENDKLAISASINSRAYSVL